MWGCALSSSVHGYSMHVLKLDKHIHVPTERDPHSVGEPFYYSRVGFFASYPVARVPHTSYQ